MSSSYINLSNYFVKPASRFIDMNWNCSNKAFDKHLFSRIGYFTLAHCSIITTVADTFIGICAGFATIITGGTDNSIFCIARNHLQSSRHLVLDPYWNFVKTLNPQAKISYSYEYNRAHASPFGRLFLQTRDEQAKITADGGITHYLQLKSKEKASGFCSSDSLFERHIASRLTYALLAISSVVARIADGIIGIPAATLSFFVTYGKKESINNLAWRGLQLFGIIDDLFYCTIKFINPWAGTSDRSDFPLDCNLQEKSNLSKELPVGLCSLIPYE